MGIALGALTFLLAEGVSNPWAGRLLTLGRQGVAVTASELDEHAAEAGYMRTRQTPAGGIADSAAGPQYLNDEQLFGALGFRAVDVMDISGHEGADIRRTVYARIRRDPVHDKWEFAEYTPGCFPTLAVLDDATYFLLVCVQRLKESRDDRVPQQSYFRERVWQYSDRVPGVDEES